MVTVADIIGVIAFAVSGALEAGEERMDLFGVIMVAFVTALGGGTLRDLCLANYPLVWVGDPWYVVLVIVTAVVTIMLSRYMKYLRELILLFDAIGLVMFSIMGAQVALKQDAGVIIACVAAVVTGVAGGIIRDLLCDRIPVVFRGELYASVAVAVALGYVSLISVGVPSSWAIAVLMLLGLAMRLAALQFKMHLPVFEYQESYYDNRNAIRRILRELRQSRRRREGPDGTALPGQPSPEEP